MASTNENTNRKETLKAKISILTKYLIELQNELDELENKEYVFNTVAVSNTVSPFQTDLFVNNFIDPNNSFGETNFIANNFYKPPPSFFGESYFVANKFYKPLFVSNQPINTHQTSSLDTTKTDSIDSNYFVFSNKDIHYV